MFPSKQAKVHVIIKSVSPKKNSTAGTSRYFSVELVTDGTSTCRVVGFDTKLHHKLKAFHDSNEPVLLMNCENKEGRYSSDLEVLVRNTSDMQRSLLNFLLMLQNEKSSPVVVPLQQLPNLSDYQDVSIKVKVTKVRDVKPGVQGSRCYSFFKTCPMGKLC